MGKIIPAIDILNQNVVRLSKGQIETAKIYYQDVLEIINSISVLDEIDRIHIVDLNRIFKQDLSNFKILESLSQKIKNKIELSGGLRNQSDLNILFNKGFKKFMLGSWAIQYYLKLNDKPFFENNHEWRLALDVYNEEIKTAGWLTSTGLNIFDVLCDPWIQSAGGLMITSIAFDGLSQGPDFKLYEKLIKNFPNLKFIASGGIRDVNDVQRLYSLGINEVIVGKSMLENPSQYNLTFNCQRV